MAADPLTGGYWLVASDGGVFSFNAPFQRINRTLQLNKPVVGTSPAKPPADNESSEAGGATLLASDGSAHGKGKRLHGSLATLSPVPSLSGLELAAGFYAEAVRPIIDQAFPGLVHSAVRIGRGSEVLGYDDQISQDHDWGPRLELFLGAADHDRHHEHLDQVLADRLPRSFRSFPTTFVPDAQGVGVLVETNDSAATHRVEIHELGRWCDQVLGFDPRQDVQWFDWLATSSHRLAEVSAGAVFHDGLGELGPIRTSLAYYPRDVWVFVMASQWKRIAQEEAFVGRCAQAGDDLGSSVIASRLVREIMRLCLMMDRRYIPYSKWLGTAFDRLEIADVLGPHLSSAIQEPDADRRQSRLGTAYGIIAERHNALALSEPVDPTLRSFWKRGFPVLLADRFADALHRQLGDSPLGRLPLVGSVDQFLDSADVLMSAHLTRAAAEGVLRDA